MNIDNENIEPGIELGLALGYSNQRIERRLMSNDSGAGANAGSGIHMTFLTTNPLSELVWSPLKGPSNVALLPAQSITGQKFPAHSKRVDSEDFLTLSTHTPFQMKGQGVGKDASDTSPGSATACVMSVRGPSHQVEAGTGGEVGETNKVGGVSVSHTKQIEEVGEGKGDSVSDSVELQMLTINDPRENQLPNFPGQLNRKRADVSSAKLDQPKPDDMQMEEIAEDPVGKDRNAESSNPTLQLGFVLTPETHCVKETKARKEKRLEKMESTSENDLHKQLQGAGNEAVALELSRKVKGSSRLAEETPPTSKIVLAKRCPSSGGVHMTRRKGKEKALSDGDLNRMVSKDEDDSHESVESCNSARSFAAGKRRRDFEEDMVDESKGFKKQMHCVHGSMSVGKQDSSFMNWISNMMKGFSQSVRDEAPIPLNVVHPDDGQENADKRLVAFDKSQEQGTKAIGFQSIFQSLYCTKAEVQETRMVNAEFQVGEASKEFESSNKTSNNSTPVAYLGENSNLGKQVLQLNERFNDSSSGNEEDSAIQPKILLDKLASSREQGNSNLEDDNTKGQLALGGKGKQITSSNSSFGKQKSKSAEQVDSEPPSAGNTTSKFCHRNDSLGSFWITRFSPKMPSPSSNPDHLNQSPDLSPKPSAECLNLVPQPQSHVGVRIDGSAPEGREHSAEDPLPVSDPMSLNKLIPALPFPVVKPSGAMASVFARRLDAFKHITSPRVTSDVACFFCGVKGHNLRDCSEIAEIELEELVRNFNTYSGAEELHCLCIRCFQHNHWAVACPKASSTKRLLIESNASFCQMHISSGNKENSTLQTNKGGICEGGDLRTKALFNWKVDETMPLKSTRCSTSPFKNHVALNPAENTLKENPIVPLSLFVTEQNSDVPKGLFDAVRGLRLSRGDILKWTNSQMSVSHIEGFFLRLRLGKWEEGLGGTGYHVARIIGTQNENKEQDTKHSILVHVGGMKCLVESRYVSNSDFLEDELMAWWSITSRNGDKIPSEEELRTKIYDYITIKYQKQQTTLSLATRRK